MTRRNGLLSTVLLMLTGAVVGLLVVGCGIRPTGVIYGQGAPQGAVSSMLVYLVDHNAVRAVARPLPPMPTAAEAGKFPTYVPPDAQALTALLAGPTASEAAGGLTSDIPANVFGEIVHDRNGGHTIPVYFKLFDGQRLSQRAVDQIACTVIAAQLIDNGPTETPFTVLVMDGGPPRDAQGCPLKTP